MPTDARTKGLDNISNLQYIQYIPAIELDTSIAVTENNNDSQNSRSAAQDRTLN